MRTKIVLLACGALGLTAAWSAAFEDVAREMQERAQHFLAALDDARRDKATFSFDDEERFNWHFTPVDRQGLPYRELTRGERRLADRLLASGLSRDGLDKAFGIMYLDQILFEREGRDIRDPGRYFVSVFGTPGGQGAWGWRIEGHHLSLNFTLRDGQVVSMSPAFMGSNPAIVRDGPHAGLEVLADEQRLARALLRLFDAEARAGVVFAEEAPRDIATSNSRRVDIGAPIGLAVRDMTPQQADALMGLIRVYLDRMRPELAQAELEKIMRADTGAIHFAWAGSAEVGAPHYYRIHGPTFLIEYDNTQSGANHVHSVWRDLTNDFGVDVLAEHYATAHAL
ncbi:MAG TPA: DUF3500 domain-containing protein [Gammaproteobacteria bacterium]